MPGGYHRGGRRTAGNGKLYDVPGEGNLKSQFKSSSVKSEVPGTPYRMSGTLEFSSCASIAPDRRALSERAEHASFARRSGNRRRSE